MLKYTVVVVYESNIARSKTTTISIMKTRIAQIKHCKSSAQQTASVQFESIISSNTNVSIGNA